MTEPLIEQLRPRPYDYLVKLPGVLTCKPVKVTLGTETYELAARYTREFGDLPGAQSHGQYVREFIYVVGLLPKIEVRSKVCYTLKNDRREWYNAGGYYNGANRSVRRQVLPATEMSPFGNFFQLAPWDDSEALPRYRGQKIDHYEKKPYMRVLMTVTDLEVPCPTTS